MQVAMVAPISMGIISSGRPRMMGMPQVRSMQFATEKVVAEMEVWIRFCRCTLRNFMNIVMGIREMMMAMIAPTREVLAVTPVLMISSMPMIAPRMQRITLTISVAGS